MRLENKTLSRAITLGLPGGNQNFAEVARDFGCLAILGTNHWELLKKKNYREEYIKGVDNLD